MTREEAKAAVQRGAALLDAKMPGWRKRIDADLLDMSRGVHEQPVTKTSACGCVCAQLAGDGFWTTTLKKLDLTWHEAEQNGFVAMDDGLDRDREWAWLTRCWREELANA